jgi:hypothetical protein
MSNLEKCRCGFYAHLIDLTDGTRHFLFSRGHIDQTAQQKLAGEGSVV